MFSSIEEESIKEVINKCYKPLLDLSDQGIPIGIEASGITLELIHKIKPSWIDHLKDNIAKGVIELIGSGYSQIIGPLVPNEVNKWNQKLGLDIYHELIGIKPKIALVNEMSFSNGIIEHYINSGYEGIIMEWDNPRASHDEWNRAFKYFPQKVKSLHDKEIYLLWARSLVFQQFQRYTHSQINLDEYLEFINRDISGINKGAVPIYSNDAEIFNFRPGRYKTEAEIKNDEWERIYNLFKHFHERADIDLVLPSKVMQLGGDKNASNILNLTSAQQPIPVKKQKKYNITRWASTGRGDVDINSRCHSIYQSMREVNNESYKDWKELCYLWSSDFRTNITEKRWNNFQSRLSTAEKKWLSKKKKINDSDFAIQSKNDREIQVINEDGIIKIIGKRINASFNLNKGLSLNSLSYMPYSKEPLIGTLKHGYFDDIDWGADYYSGHLIIQPPEKPQFTDLEPVEAKLKQNDLGLEISTNIRSSKVNIEKSWYINDYLGILTLRYRFEWLESISGSMRLGHLTIMPESFSSHELVYGSHNGGLEENFVMGDKDFDHGKPVSSRVTASHGLGLTEGLIYIGDRNKKIRVELDSKINAIGLINYSKVDDKYFFRLSFSANEMDDTSKRKQNIQSFSMKISLDPIIK